MLAACQAMRWLDIPTVTPTPSPTPFATETPAWMSSRGAVATSEPLPSPTVAVVNPFGAITFAPGVFGDAPNVRATETFTQFSEGVTMVYALAQVDRAFPGSRWRSVWYVNDKPRPDLAARGWDIEPGLAWTNVWQANGLDVGNYEIHLLVDDQVVQKNRFTINPRALNAPGFGAIRFAENSQDDKPVNAHRPTENFNRGIKRVWAFFDVVRMSKGTAWKWEWSRNDTRLENVGGAKIWDAAQNEKDWWLSLFNDNQLDPGTYTLKLYIADALAQIGTFVVD